jgi:hypothetical protein
MPIPTSNLTTDRNLHPEAGALVTPLRDRAGPGRYHQANGSISITDTDLRMQELNTLKQNRYQL